MNQQNHLTQRWASGQNTGSGNVAPFSHKRPVIIQLVLDATGSMEPYLKSVVMALVYLLDSLVACNLSPVFSLTIFWDELLGEYPDVYPIGTPPEKIKNILKATQARNGGDVPESDLPAIMKTLDLSSGQTPQKVIILLTDAPSHDPESGISSSQVMARLSREKVLFFACSPEISPYTDFVRATQGMLFPIKPDMNPDSFKVMFAQLTATTVKTMRAAETQRLLEGLSGDRGTKLLM